MSAAGEGWTEPNLYFRPLGGNANESVLPHHKKTNPFGLVFLCVSGSGGRIRKAALSDMARPQASESNLTRYKKHLICKCLFRLICLAETLLVSAACCVLFHCMNIILLEQPGLIYIIQCILTDTDFGPCFFACDYQSKRFRNALDAIPDNQKILI